MAIECVKPKKIYQQLYFKILIAVLIGAGLGHFHPHLGADMKPFGDAFIKLIKMLLAPIIFATVVLGIATIVVANWENGFDRNEAEAIVVA